MRDVKRDGKHYGTFLGAINQELQGRGENAECWVSKPPYVPLDLGTERTMCRDNRSINVQPGPVFAFKTTLQDGLANLVAHLLLKLGTHRTSRDFEQSALEQKTMPSSDIQVRP